MLMKGEDDFCHFIKIFISIAFHTTVKNNHSEYIEISEPVPKLTELGKLVTLLY